MTAGATPGPPSSYQLIVRPLAQEDIEVAALWYEDRALGLGDRFLAAVDACVLSILQGPEHYPEVYRDARRALVDDFPYAVHYVVRGLRIYVVACTHGRRHPRRWQGRVDRL